MSKTKLAERVAVIVTVTTLAVACSNNGGGTTTRHTKPVNGPQSHASALFDTASVNAPVHEGNPSRGGSITFGLESDVLNVSPNQSLLQPADQQVASAVFASLVSFDDKGIPVTDETDHHANQLAETVTHTPDLRTWTVKLRAGLKFSNGVDLTAHQVVDHTEWVKSSGTCDCNQDAQNINSVTASGVDTVTYVLGNPVVDWPAKLTRGGLGWITESSARTSAGDPTSPDIGHLVGAGPFAYESRSGDSYTVVANTHYFGVDRSNGNAKLPYLNQITFKPLADSVTRLQALQSNSVQIMQTADTANLVQAKKDKSLTVQPAQGTSATIIGLNLTRPPFGVAPKPGEDAQAAAIRALDDPTALAARRAFNAALNRNEINQKYYSGTRLPAYGLIPEGNPWYDKAGQLPRFDPTGARALLDKVVAAGVKPDLSYLCINTPQSTGMFTIAQPQFESVGFASTFRPVDQAILVQNLLAGSGSIAWTAACFRAPQMADPNQLSGLLGTGGSTNFVKYSRPRVDTWLAEARTTTDPATRKKAYDKVLKQFAHDVVYVPTLYDYYGNVFRNTISGVSAPLPNALGIIQPGGLYRKS